MKVLIDTNVVLDLLLNRKPFSEDAELLISKVEEGEIVGLLCATTVTNIYYITKKHLSKKEADEALDVLLSLFDIAPVNKLVLELARDLNFKDYEDAVIYASAVYSNVNAVITRNKKDFKDTDIPIYTPQEFLEIFKI